MSETIEFEARAMGNHVLFGKAVPVPEDVECGVTYQVVMARIESEPEPECIEFSGGSICLDDDGVLSVKLNDEAADKLTGFRVYQNSSIAATPEPLCPVCGKPAGEHRDELWCCGHCGRGAYMTHSEHLYQARCCGARCGIAGLWYSHHDNAHKDWNRRA